MKFMIYLWLCGAVFTYIGISGMAGGDAGVVLVVGLAFFAVAGLLTWAGRSAAKRAEKADDDKKLAEDAAQERNITRIAHLEGLNKLHEMDLLGAQQYQQGIDAMRELGGIVERSVHQEKEKDWAIHGGLAQGIAGPIAGVATAMNVMHENEEIRARNAANRDWGRRQNDFYQRQADEAERNRPKVLTMYQLQQKFDVNLSWAPATLFSKLSFSEEQSVSHERNGATIVSVKWSQRDRSVCIDGSLRAKLYDSKGRCAGCAYMIFPKNGTASRQGKLFGYCTKPKYPGPYTVKIEPANLWELADKGYASKRTDNLSDEAHRKLVAEIEQRYLAELN